MIWPLVIKIYRSSPDLSDLDEDKVNINQGMLDKFSDVFTSELGFTNVLQYQIQLTDTTPVKLSPYRLSPPKMQIMRKIISDMLDKGNIRYSTSQYSSPIFLVPKPNDGYRPTVDYRVLNSKMKIDIHSCFT